MSNNISNEDVIARFNNLCGSLSEATESVTGIIHTDDADHPLLQELFKIRKDLQDNKFRVGLFGVTAAGKSTLTNALMGEKLLMEGQGETTRTITEICAPTEDYPDGQVVLHYKTKKQVDKEVEQHLADAGFVFGQGTKCDLADPVFRSELHANISGIVADDMDLEASSKYLEFLLEGWDECKDLLGQIVEIPKEAAKEADALVHQERIASFIHKRYLYHDCALTRDNFVFIDAPGVGSNCARHTSEAARVARDVDAAILVTKVDYQFMPPDRRFLREAMDAQRMQARKNLIFVLNQISRINPMQADPPREPDQFDECVDEQVDRLRGRLAESGIEQAEVHPIDAACGQWAPKFMASQQDPITAGQFYQYAFPHCMGDPKLNLVASRLDEFKQALNRHLTSIRYHSFLSTKLDRLVAANKSYLNEVTEIIEGYGKTLEKLREELEDHKIKKEKVREYLQEYLEHTVKSKLQAAYKNIEGDVDKLVDFTAETFARLYVKYEPISTHPHKIVISKTKEIVYPRLEKIRNHFEQNYNQMKKIALDERIPEIIDKYGEVKVPLKRGDLSTKLTHSLRALSEIKITMWQHLTSWLLSILPGKDKESILREGLIEKYKADFCESYKKNITAWVYSDWNYFGEQVKDKFDHLMTQIEGAKRKQIALEKSTEAERKEYKAKLKKFAEQSKEAMERLADLEEEIERARPHSDLPN